MLLLKYYIGKWNGGMFLYRNAWSDSLSIIFFNSSSSSIVNQLFPWSSVSSLKICKFRVLSILASHIQDLASLINLFHSLSPTSKSIFFIASTIAFLPSEKLKFLLIPEYLKLISFFTIANTISTGARCGQYRGSRFISNSKKDAQRFDKVDTRIEALSRVSITSLTDQKFETLRYCFSMKKKSQKSFAFVVPFFKIDTHLPSLNNPNIHVALPVQLEFKIRLILQLEAIYMRSNKIVESRFIDVYNQFIFM